MIHDTPEAMAELVAGLREATPEWLPQALYAEAADAIEALVKENATLCALLEKAEAAMSWPTEVKNDEGRVWKALAAIKQWRQT